MESVEDTNPELARALGEDGSAKLFDDVHHRPRAAIPVIEGLLKRFPRERMLYNWLAVAYGGIGDTSRRSLWWGSNSWREPDIATLRKCCSRRWRSLRQTARRRAQLQ